MVDAIILLCYGDLLHLGVEAGAGRLCGGPTGAGQAERGSRGEPLGRRADGRGVLRSPGGYSAASA